MSLYVTDRRRVLAMACVTGCSAPALEADSFFFAQGTAVETCPMIEEFGAIGDGASNDSSAFERAIATTPAGGAIRLRGGRSYRLTRSLVLTRPLIITGGTKEHTRLLFDDGNYARLGRFPTAIIIPHELGREFGAGTTARRSALSGFTVAWIGSQSATVHGLLTSAPVYLNEVDTLSFPGDGFRIEAQSEMVSGNANGSSFINCSARSNRGNGFAFHGNNANACVLLGSRAFDNGLDGFYDGSLLGNTYVAGEADGNQGAGYASIKTTPNRSVYIGCYAEPNQRYDLNRRNLVIGALGQLTGISASAIRSLPSGELFSPASQVFAESEDIAAGAAENIGAYLRTGREGIDIGSGDGQRVRLTKLLSENYIDFLNGDEPLIRFPARDVGGNIEAKRPWMPQGMVVGENGASGILGAGSSPPTQGRFGIGALWLNEAPQTYGHIGWVCTMPGQPGRWQPFGRIEDAS